VTPLAGRDRVVTSFDKLEPGIYRVSYLARASSVGAFVVPPTRIEAMYSPEVFGRTAASTLWSRSASRTPSTSRT
jgi:alpha-2-macroglobulin